MKSYIKLNLYLHVKGKRADGYHILDSLVIFMEFHDVLKFEKTNSDNIEIEISGDYKPNIDGSKDNIIVKAANLLKKYTNSKNLGAKIYLNKNIPVGAGLGGGSSNAAATLKALNNLWNLNLDANQLNNLALKLGADVPVCIKEKTSFMSGIGEVIEESLPLPEMFFLLVNPRKELSTIEVFKKNNIINNESKGAIDLKSSLSCKSGKQIKRDGFLSFLKECGNDLTESAIKIIPEISKILKNIESQEGNLLARMSGSGATCFGIFESQEDLDKAFDNIKNQNQDWWVIKTKNKV